MRQGVVDHQWITRFGFTACAGKAKLLVQPLTCCHCELLVRSSRSVRPRQKLAAVEQTVVGVSDWLS